MSNSKMLIDASHPEETRVVVLKGNRVEEFDFESASKKQLRGNIYLAKVTRVEPSLQAAFIEYGGNRHGFLAFSEIHPDYYQIPFADRQALLEEEARAHRDEDEEPRGGESRGGGENRGGGESRGGGENRDGRRGRRGGGERSGNGEGRANGEGGGGREGGERGARAGGRGERGQRRSRRHRRDDAPATAFDRRGSTDESISEPAFEIAEGIEVIARETGPDEEVAMAAGGDLPDVLTGGVDAGPSDAVAGEGDEIATAVQAEAAAGDPEATETRSEREAPDEVPADPTMPEADDVAIVAAVEETRSIAAQAEDAAEVPGGQHVGPEGTDVADPAPAGMLSQDRPVDHGGDVVADGDQARDDGVEAEDGAQHRGPAEAREARERQDDDHHDDEHHVAEREEEHVEQIGGDALSDVAPRPVRLRRHYKIQEVIKRRQILLIQVVKEERGNKGAALTTYLSLAGRYSVLMPNTAKGGGISRKITDGDDRKRLKAIAGELDVPEGMGVILRTAGASRSPIEVKRDFEYLLRMWESVRELTLKSSAPTLVYEEGSLIKRSIRDLYSKEVEEVVVSGEAGFAEARDFMQMLMPGNVKAVQLYRDPQPVFAKSGVEAQLDSMFSPHVTLKSGGYLVINQTEALVAIDVNSGRSTREHNIEDTALRTNMEAADEVARQLRLRDLAGLIVVDFIDMEEGRNNRAVERRIKEALKNDRARIQIGRISHFGLLEMSRQRIRTGVLEGSTVVCPHCAGAGTVRSTASIALHVLRLVEDALLKDASHDLILQSRAEVALYVLNQKRAKLVELEQRFGITLTVAADPTLTGMVYHAIERGELATPAVAPAPRQDLVRVDSIAPIFEPADEIEDEVQDLAEAGGESEGDGTDEPLGTASSSESGEGEGRRRKRRRRRRGRDRDGAGETSADASQPSDDALATMAEIGGDLMPAPDEDGADAAPVAERGSADPVELLAEAGPAPTLADLPEGPLGPPVVEPAAEEAPKRRRSRRTPARSDEAETASVEALAPAGDEPPAPPRRRRPSRARASEASVETPAAPVAASEPVGARPSADRDVGADTVEHHAPGTESEALAVFAEPLVATAAADVPPPTVVESKPAAPDPDRPKRSGWWQRAKDSFSS